MFGKKHAAYHIDRVESRYGNVMIRGWAAGFGEPEEAGALKVSVLDGKGAPLSVYQERLAREDVNERFGLEKGCESGFHILVDRAVLDTPEICLVFTNGKETLKKKIRINVHSPLERLYDARFGKRWQEDYDLWIRRQAPERSPASRRRAR